MAESSTRAVRALTDRHTDKQTTVTLLRKRRGLTRLTRVKNIYVFTLTPGHPTGEIHVLMEHTDGQSDHRNTPAHARQGLINL